MIDRQARARPDLAVIDADVASMVDAVGDLTEALAGATILITGAGGMIGGYLADLAVGLNDSGRLARPMMVVLTTRQIPTAVERVAHLVGRSDVQFVGLDDLATHARTKRVQFVIHAASPAAPTQYLRDPIATLDANSVLLGDLLRATADSGTLQGFCYLSTSEVYGSPPADAIPTPETFIGTTDPIGERASYVEAKRFGEALCMAYHRQRDAPVSIVRLFHVHGPGLRRDDGRIVAALMQAALAGEPFRLASDGSATRCYGYVADAATGIYRALVQGSGDVFNIGVDGPEASILELARAVADLAGTPPPIATPSAGPVHLAGAPTRSRPDLTKARARLGYAPTVSLRDGLERTLRWFRAREAMSA